MKPTTDRVIEKALEVVGCKYVWAGKGDTVGGKPVPDDWGLVFDCSGLVTWAWWKAGGPDYRSTHNAQKLFDMCRLGEVFRPDCLHLAFFGRSATQVSHVAIVLNNRLPTILLQAAGGDHFSISPQVSKGRVMVNVNRRLSDFLGMKHLELNP